MELSKIILNSVPFVRINANYVLNQTATVQFVKEIELTCRNVNVLFFFTKIQLLMITVFLVLIIAYHALILPAFNA